MEEPPDHTLEELGSILGIPNLIAIQDWELEFADPERVTEFCDAYETGEFSSQDRFAIMQLIVASYDQRLYAQQRMAANPQADLETRIYDLLKRDFKLHRYTIDYWSALKSPNPKSFWRVTPLMRKLLKESDAEA